MIELFPTSEMKAFWPDISTTTEVVTVLAPDPRFYFTGITMVRVGDYYCEYDPEYDRLYVEPGKLRKAVWPTLRKSYLRRCFCGLFIRLAGPLMVKIEVRGGVAHVIESPSGVSVEIVDYDVDEVE